MSHSPALTRRYDTAAPRWGDKMRTLGYADAYLGFLANMQIRPGPDTRVCDVGCGSGAFAEAWLGVNGSGADLTLLDPSGPMLDRARSAIARRGTDATAVASGLDAFTPAKPFDHLLVAHVIEHVADPGLALTRLRGWAAPGARLWLVASKPHWCNAIIWLQWRHRAFRMTEAADLLAESGWRLDATYAFPSGPPSRTSRGYLATAA
jgi:ubiquinone/menaquinone biosynthesis C-methylase UbiE